MSLNQKYTWKDFLKENPDLAKKEIKRTSPEGKKAFESAFKSHIKKYLEQRSAKFEKDIEKANKRRSELVGKLKDLNKTKKLLRAKQMNQKIGTIDAAIARHEKQKERTKTVQKNFK